ncbi:MAG: hypothetical protein ACLFWL_03580 [Candidatus Brocadiia bacterium]
MAHRIKNKYHIGGYMMAEAMVGIFVFGLLMATVVTAFMLQTESVCRAAVQSRARFLLQGEMERLRAIGPDELKTGEEETFNPALPVHESLKEATFTRNVEKQDGECFLRIHLRADVAMPGDKIVTSNVCGVLPAERERFE